MKSSTQIEIELWKKKIKNYIKTNEQTSFNSKALIPINKIPTDITVSKKLSDKVTISISNNHKNENGFFCFSFYYNNYKIFGRFSNYNDAVNLFNSIYENFKKDNSEIQKKIKPIVLKEQKYLSILTDIKSFANNMMNGSGFEWKIIEYENITVLQIKLNSPRIIEIEIHHKAFTNHPELFNEDKILNSIIKINEALENVFLPVNQGKRM